MTATVTPLQSFGVEIGGLNIGALDDEQAALVRKAFSDHGLVVFRDQELTPEDQIAFAESVGEINVNRFFAKHPEYPRIALVVKEKDQTWNIGSVWHTDHSYDVDTATGSILLAREIPPVGGDTLYSSMYLAYENLPAAVRDRCEGLEALHSARHAFGKPAEAMRDVVHKVFITHPVSGKKAMFVNAAFTRCILGISKQESDDLLGLMYEHGQKDEFVHVHKWQVGSVAMWDNRSTWHYAPNDYQGYRREMHRITLDGCPIEGSRYATDEEQALITEIPDWIPS